MVTRRPLPPTLSADAFSFAEAREQGVTPGRLRGRDLARPFRGVRAVMPPTTHLDLCRAYAALMRASEYFSHATAARAHGIPLPWRLEAEPLHVTAVLPDGRPRGRGVHGHAVAPELARFVIVGGLRVSHPVEAWCELATTLTLRELIAIGDALVRRQHPLATMTELADAVLRWRGRRGCVALTEALTFVRPRTDSWEETMLRLDLIDAGLPEPEVNAEIRDRDGRFVALGDLAFREYRVLAEYDGQQHRTDDRQYQRDVERLDDLARLGWRTVRFTRLHRGPARTERIGRVRSALHARGWQPG